VSKSTNKRQSVRSVTAFKRVVRTFGGKPTIKRPKKKKMEPTFKPAPAKAPQTVAVEDVHVTTPTLNAFLQRQNDHNNKIKTAAAELAGEVRKLNSQIKALTVEVDAAKAQTTINAIEAQALSLGVRTDALVGLTLTPPRLPAS